MMPQCLQSWCPKLGLVISMAIGGAIAFLGDCANAQVTPDGTLPNNSIVTPSGKTSVISGGTQAGSNLFHSFEQFSVPTGGAAYFNNALNIQNIISRVTGKSISNIDGSIRANGTANLFLLNPNGIIFGPNASLNIGGSFVASTANAVNFADGTNFSATAPKTTPLLSVSVPLGLQYGRTTPGGIQVQQSILQVQPNQTLALMGGDVSIEGEGYLQALGGRIELGGLADAGMVEIEGQLSEGAFELESLRFPDAVSRADVSLTDKASVNVAAGGGGSIAITAQNINIAGGSFLRGGLETNLGFPGAQVGDITLNATGAIAIANGFIYNNVRTGSVGNGGGIDITTGDLFVTNGARIDASTSGQGNAGNVNINARDTVSFDGVSNGLPSSALSNVQLEAIGNAGDINITAGSFLATNGARVESVTYGQGNGSSVNINALDTVSFDGVGSYGWFSGAYSTVEKEAVGNSGGINITTRSLSVNNGALITANTFGKGNAGRVNINARDTVFLKGAESAVFSEVHGGAVGNSGGINITTGSLSVNNGALIGATTFGKGHAGSVNINARDTVSFDGNSRASSEVLHEAVGNSGGIDITTGVLSLTNEAVLATSTFGQGNGGTININARDTVSFDRSTAFSQVEGQAVGNSGGINIRAGLLSLTDGAVLRASTLGQGNAGTININARDTVSFDRSLALSEVENQAAVGNSGGIDITTGVLSLANSAVLATSTFGQGNGGTININARDKVSFDRSTAFSQVEGQAVGNSGGINITAGLLSLTDGAVLRASTLGQGNAGTININARDTVSFDRSLALSEVENQAAVGNSGGIDITTGVLSLTNEAVLATSSFGQGNGGTININARDTFSLTESGVSSQVGDGAVGNSGDINITTELLSVTNSAVLRTSTFNQAVGNGGNINLTVEALSVTNGAQLQASSRGRGDAGNVNINARDIVEFEGVPSKKLHSAVYTTVEENAVGNSGDINITTGSLSLTNGAILVASNSGEGSGGDVNINARNTVYFKGNNSIEFPTAASSGVSSPKAKGDGGNINITANSLSMTNGAQLYSNTLGIGKAGNVNINARDRVSFDGEQSSALSTVGEEAVGKGGDINITAGLVFVMNGATLAASTFGQGDAGNVNINGGNINIPTQSLSVTNGAKLFSSTDGKGNAGSVNINTRDLVVRDGAEANVSSEGLGSAGNLNIKADIIRLENQGKLTAFTAAGTGGNITLLDLNLLLMRDRSLISAEARGSANGGNITINAKDGFIVAVPRENSDIIANAFEGNGGRINITSSGIYGLENRSQQPRDSNRSEINASSEVGTDGAVEVNTLDIDPAQGLVNLPIVPIETEVVQACTPGGSQQQSEFVITGRGGLPPNPTDFLNSDAVWIDLDSTTQQVENRPSSEEATQQTLPTPGQLVEATGWELNDKGEVVLIASAPTATPHSSGLTPANCHVP